MHSGTPGLLLTLHFLNNKYFFLTKFLANQLHIQLKSSLLCAYRWMVFCCLNSVCTYTPIIDYETARRKNLNRYAFDAKVKVNCDQAVISSGLRVSGRCSNLIEAVSLYARNPAK